MFWDLCVQTFFETEGNYIFTHELKKLRVKKRLGGVGLQQQLHFFIIFFHFFILISVLNSSLQLVCPVLAYVNQITWQESPHSCAANTLVFDCSYIVLLLVLLLLSAAVIICIFVSDITLDILYLQQGCWSNTKYTEVCVICVHDVLIYLNVLIQHICSPCRSTSECKSDSKCSLLALDG